MTNSLRCEIITIIKKLPKNPHIFLFISHDTGKYFSTYGAPIKTPNFDKFAKNGVKFTNYFATAPQCSPSRSSILTGKYPHVNGLLGLTHHGWNLPLTNLTMPEYFAQHFYETYLIGLQHTHMKARKLGYEHVSPRRDFPYYASKVRRRFKNLIEKMKAKQNNNPVFCSIGVQETHRPYLQPKRTETTSRKNVKLPSYLPNTPGTRRELGKFEGSLKTLDNHIGKMVKMIETSPFFKKSIIVFTVDHGIPFPRAKCTLYDSGIETALMIYWPSIIEGGYAYDHLISNVDLFPTLAELAGIPLPEYVIRSINGRSFANLLLGQDYQERKHIFAEMTFHEQGFNPIRSIRTKEWKYIRNFSNFKNVLFQIPGDALNSRSGRQYLQHHPEYFCTRPTQELYHLTEDPHELENLAKNPTYQKILQEMDRKLMNFLQDTNDPILEGEPEQPKKPKKRFY